MAVRLLIYLKLKLIMSLWHKWTSSEIIHNKQSYPYIMSLDTAELFHSTHCRYTGIL